MIDQRRLPAEEVYLRCRDHHEVARAIKDMAIRGAPAIGVAAALRHRARRPARGREGACAPRRRSRRSAPSWRPRGPRRSTSSGPSRGCAALRRARRAREARRSATALLQRGPGHPRRGRRGLPAHGGPGRRPLPRDARLLTHCNAGALATAGYGTALGVIRSAARQGKVRRVFADETRPYLQGRAAHGLGAHARTASPRPLIADNMAGHLMSRGEVDAVIVGADRIAAQRRRGQQDRHLHAWRCWRRRTACRSTWPRRSRPSTSRRPRAPESRSRSARPRR